MDRIHYAGDSLLTGTEIARALLDYAKALAQAGSSDTVDIPIVGSTGEVGRAEVLVGPASQILTTSEKSDFDEIADPDLVSDLLQKAESLRRFGASSTGAEVRPGEPPQGWDDFDEI